ncbi:MAG: hypothetical protein AB8B91_18435 [Rubripirellula sp.]
MPRRPPSNDDEISLFPFLSIIACVIGVLTMMIATLALAQTDTPDIAMIEEFEQKEKELKKSDEKIEELQREVAVSNSSALEMRDQKKLLDMTIDELQAMLEELEKIEKELAEQGKVKIVIPMLDPKLRESAADMQSEAQALKEQIAQLEAELNDRKDKSEAKVTVLPQGSGLSFTPHFVECAAGAIVMHNLSPPKRVRTADVVKDEDFIRLMELVLNGKDDSIVFMLRSDGLGTFRAVKRICDDREIRNGKIPVVGKGRIDLSAFVEGK